MANERVKRKVRARLRHQSSKPYTMAVRCNNRNTYVLLMETKSRVVLGQVSTLSKAFKAKHAYGSNKAAAFALGQIFAEYVKEKGISGGFAFDRGGQRFWGRLAEVVRGAREAGLEG